MNINHLGGMTACPSHPRPFHLSFRLFSPLPPTQGKKERREEKGVEGKKEEGAKGRQSREANYIEERVEVWKVKEG